jgi:hypothetical protein
VNHTFNKEHIQYRKRPQEEEEKKGRTIFFPMTKKISIKRESKRKSGKSRFHTENRIYNQKRKRRRISLKGKNGMTKSQNQNAKHGG